MEKFITRSLNTSENLIGRVEPQAHIQEKGNRTFLPTASCGAHDRIHCRSCRRVWKALALWSVACNRAHLGEQHSYQAWREREMNENCGKVSVGEWIGRWERETIVQLTLRQPLVSVYISRDAVCMASSSLWSQSSHFSFYYNYW